MTHRLISGVALLAAMALAACQSYEAVPQQTSMDGQWAASNGVFVATFQGGSFTSRLVETNEILAQGTYTVTGDSVSMRWLSVQAQEQRSANCTFIDASTLRCQQVGGGSFDLQRTA